MSSERDYLPAENTFAGIMEPFLEYLADDFGENAAKIPNQFSVQTRDLRSLSTTKQEILVFTGIRIIMGCL